MSEHKFLYPSPLLVAHMKVCAICHRNIINTPHIAGIFEFPRYYKVDIYHFIAIGEAVFPVRVKSMLHAFDFKEIGHYRGNLVSK